LGAGFFSSPQPATVIVAKAIATLVHFTLLIILMSSS
jgi:hypothetical protein